MFIHYFHYWPFKVTQGHAFWGQWKGDEGLNSGFISKAFEVTENRCLRLLYYRLTPHPENPCEQLHKPHIVRNCQSHWATFCR